MLGFAQIFRSNLVQILPFHAICWQAVFGEFIPFMSSLFLFTSFTEDGIMLKGYITMYLDFEGLQRPWIGAYFGPL